MHCLCKYHVFAVLDSKYLLLFMVIVFNVFIVFIVFIVCLCMCLLMNSVVVYTLFHSWCDYMWIWFTLVQWNIPPTIWCDERKIFAKIPSEINQRELFWRFFFSLTSFSSVYVFWWMRIERRERICEWASERATEWVSDWSSNFELCISSDYT